jgi:hypothetical protein
MCRVRKGRESVSEEFKFQVSLKNNTGALLNIRANQPEEFQVNIDSIFGGGAYDGLMATFGPQSAAGPAQPAAAAPQPQPQPVAPGAPTQQPVPAGQPMSADQVAQAFNQPPVSPPQQWGAAPAPAQGSQQGGPPCEGCGTPKQWKSGVSKKTGKPYGFFGCPNFGSGNPACK